MSDTADDLWQRHLRGEPIRGDLARLLKSTYGLIPGHLSPGQAFVMISATFTPPTFDTDTVTLLRGVASTEDPLGYFWLPDSTIGLAVATRYAQERSGLRGVVYQATAPTSAVWAALPRFGTPPAVSYVEYVVDPELIESVEPLIEVRTPLRL